MWDLSVCFFYKDVSCWIIKLLSASVECILVLTLLFVIQSRTISFHCMLRRGGNKGGILIFIINAQENLEEIPFMPLALCKENPANSEVILFSSNMYLYIYVYSRCFSRYLIDVLAERWYGKTFITICIPVDLP